MPYFNIDGSKSRVVRTVSDRLDLGPNGPRVITQVGMTLLMTVVVLIFSSSLWGSGDAEGPLKFAPLIIIGFLIAMIVRSVRSARKDVKDGWEN